MLSSRAFRSRGGGRPSPDSSLDDSSLDGRACTHGQRTLLSRTQRIKSSMGYYGQHKSLILNAGGYS